MPPVGREEFDDALRGLEPDGLARFVADLHRTRGATVERSGTRVIVTDGERTREFAVADHGARVDPEADTGPEADAVVAVDGRGGPGVLDAEALRRLLLYGIDRETCSTLVERHLGRPLDSFAGEDGGPSSATSGNGGRSAAPGGSFRTTTAEGSARRPRRTDDRAVAAPGIGRDRDTGGATARNANLGAGDAGDHDAEKIGPSETVSPSAGRRLPGRRTAFAVLFVLVLTGGLAGALAVGVPGVDGDGVGGDGTGDVGPTGSPPETVDPSEVDAAAAVERAGLVDGTLENGFEPVNSSDRSVGNATGLPPGIAASGEIDERAVADRTVAALSNRSYRLTIVVRESVDGRPTAVRREVVRVEDATTYAASITRAGRFLTEPPRLADREVYANGTARFVREPNGTVRRSALGSGADVPYAEPLDRYLRWYLSVSESTVVDTTAGGGFRAVWLRLDGDPYPGVVNTSGSALVDRGGVVREVHRSYGLPNRPGVAVAVTLRIEELGGAELPPPGWVTDGSAGARWSSMAHVPRDP